MSHGVTPFWHNDTRPRVTVTFGARRPLDFIQAMDTLLQRGILFEQGFNLFFHRLDLGLEMGHELGVLSADKGKLMMLGLGFGQGSPVNQLLQPLGQGHQLVLGGEVGGVGSG